jgi:hypothetical protein
MGEKGINHDDPLVREADVDFGEVVEDYICGEVSCPFTGLVCPRISRGLDCDPLCLAEVLDIQRRFRPCDEA